MSKIALESELANSIVRANFFVPTVQFFFSVYVFGEPAVHFRNFSLCCPSQRSARSQVPSLGGNPPGDWQSAVGWGDVGFEPGTAGQQPGVLPLSYHAYCTVYVWSLLQLTLSPTAGKDNLFPTECYSYVMCLHHPDSSKE